ncbi:MAG: hypothetical protein RID07_00805, partial [Lacipirellulaceae bacterium]
LALDPKSVKTFAHPKVSKDYLSNDFDGPDGRKPGPFQALEKGENTFKVWHGLPLLKDGELPPKEWNQLSQEDSQKP